jgi:septum formation protein
MTSDQDRDDPVAKPILVLASASPRRLALLGQAGIVPDRVVATAIDETPGARELPRDVAKRLSREKARACAPEPQAFLLAADTVVGVGRRVLPKAETEAEARACLDLLSGRAHRVWTAVTLVAPSGAERQRVTETRVRFKRLGPPEIAAYLASGEWRGKAGGYAIQGLAGAFVLDLVGSYTGVVGLPLYETMCLLEGEGYPVRGGWAAEAKPGP